ncbi:N-acetylmuramate alpha-1-phosphate uridylyltransferase MurU [Ralstonia sp. SET104]|uniref:N-acetylmuramate alpha-1-phosphate uridylyltransferase MurU n=1 Tax=Ralstonia sp. SET104 TaxID=2448774 RepID=UPI000F579F65|nr:nucleotidyltransferase family protein [Ralstonia sp. SET104]GCB04983.1 mannose-1-phosphate guanylyltransferase [Ralstonia sp. SET104]
MKAMIFAAGRGDRMRPLTDHTPKPLLNVGGKPLIVWQIERLASAGVRDIVINHAWLGTQIEAALGDGSAWGVRLAYSPEGQALETAGGVAQAMPLLHAGAGHSVFIAVSGDVFCDYDYTTLCDHAPAMVARATPGMHLVMVPNPPYHLRGDFALDNEGTLHVDGAERLTFGNIGLYDTRLFAGIAPGTRLAMTPLYHQAIAEGRATGERFDGRWENVGTPGQLAALDAEVSA